MSEAILDAAEAALAVRPLRAAALSGGNGAGVWRLDMPDGAALAAKTGGAAGVLSAEGWMLEWLAAQTVLPVPRVLHAADDLLVMTYVEAGDAIDETAERCAADLLAALHGVTGDRFGFPRDTPLCGLMQPNGWMTGWRDFFRDRRIMPMALAAMEEGRLPAELMGRVDQLCAQLDRWIADDVRPALIHGDMWGGNVLVQGGRISAFIDPALSYSDPEIELAFATLFHTFGDAFFARYAEHAPLRPGFFETRRDLYNLYPALVHVRLFGGTYHGMVDTLLCRCGV